MKFLKDNSYDIVKLFINQVGIAIFSMALYSAVAIAIPGDASLASTLEIIVSISATVFYLVLLYIAAWEIGAKDKIKIDSDKIEQKNFKGMLLGVFANTPNFILCGLAVIFMAIFLAGGVTWCKNAFGILNLFFGFLESMYLGVIINVFPISDSAPALVNDTVYFYRSIAYLIAPALPIAATSCGYLLGVKNIKVFVFASRKRND